MTVREFSAGGSQTANDCQRRQTVYVQLRGGTATICPGKRSARAVSGLQASSSAPALPTCANGVVRRRLTRRDALAASRGFSTLLDVRRPDDGPGVDPARRLCRVNGDLVRTECNPSAYAYRGSKSLTRHSARMVPDRHKHGRRQSWSCLALSGHLRL
jgi:hypothetical protein